MIFMVGDRVKKRRAGYGVVCGESVPPSRLYVRVRFDSGRETNVLIEELESSCKVDRCDGILFREHSVFYEVAGMLLRGGVSIKVSTTKKSVGRVIELLDSLCVEYEIGETVSVSETNARDGAWWWLCARDNGWVSLISDYLPNAHDMRAGWGFLSSRPFVFFLLDELKFKMGNKQDLEAIAKRVPELFREAFVRGLAP